MNVKLTVLQYLTAITQKIVLHNSTFPTGKVIIKIQRNWFYGTLCTTTCLRNTDIFHQLNQWHQHNIDRILTPIQLKTLNWTIHWTHKINRCSSNGYSTFAQSRQCSVG